jgi:NAD dependent epimerase/dehydratase family enzyme
MFRIPKFALRLKFGEGADTFASGQSVLPKRLLDAGFRFSFNTIEEAISDIVK